MFQIAVIYTNVPLAFGSQKIIAVEWKSEFPEECKGF